MTSLFIFIFGFFSIWFSKAVYSKWFNPVSLYTIIWVSMIILYNWRLLNYFPLAERTYYVIVFTYVCFTIGSYTIIAAKKIFPTIKKTNDKFVFNLLADDGTTLKWFIFAFGIISILLTLFNVYLLLIKYKSIAGILLAGNQIYRSRVEGSLGDLPYIGFTIYIGVFFSAIYTAYKGKLTFIAILPLIGAVMKGLTSFARIGMLVWLIEFISTFLLFRHFLFNSGNKLNRLKVIMPVFIFFILIFLTSSVIKNFRGTFERYKGASKELRDLSDNPFISPSIYLYLSSHVGVLNQYLLQDKEVTKFGQITFSPYFNIMAKFGIIEPVKPDLKGYYIPMWTNTSTYLRNIHTDFGDVGLVLIPYLIGIFTSYFWKKFYEQGSIICFMLLVHFFMLIGLSFFAIITQGADWYLSIISLLFLIPLVEKVAVSNSKKL